MRKALRRVVAALAALLVVQTGVWAVPANADSVDDLVRAEMAKRKVPGAALAVVQNGEAVKIATYGFADLEREQAVERDTLFELFSLTKVVTAAAVMRLVERKQIELDAPVSSYLTELPAGWAEITVRDCLAHTSGLPDVIDENEHLRAITFPEALSVLSMLPRKQPGEEALYNQTGYVLLRALVERVTARPFEDYLSDEFFTPLGLRSTRFADSRDVVAGRASWYTNLQPSPDRRSFLVQDGKPVPGETLFVNHSFFPPMMRGAAGLMASIDDLVGWEQALAGGRIISPAALLQTLQVPRLRDNSSGPFGLGWATATFEGRRFMTFGGGNSVVYLRFPDDGLTIIFLSNLQGADPNSIAIAIAQKFLSNTPA